LFKGVNARRRKSVLTHPKKEPNPERYDSVSTKHGLTRKNSRKPSEGEEVGDK